MKKHRFPYLKKALSSISSLLMAVLLTLTFLPATPVQAGNISWEGPTDTTIHFSSGSTKQIYFYTAGNPARPAYCIEPNNLHHTARKEYSPRTYDLTDTNRKKIAWAIVSTAWGASGQITPSNLDRINTQALAWSLVGQGAVTKIDPWQTKAQYDAWCQKNVTDPIARETKGIAITGGNTLRFVKDGGVQTVYLRCNEELANRNLFTTTAQGGLTVAYVDTNGSGTAAGTGRKWMRIRWNGTTLTGNSVTVDSGKYFAPTEVTQYSLMNVHGIYLQDILNIAGV